MKKSKHTLFKGWDWLELAYAWNVYIPEDYWMGVDSGVKFGFHASCDDYDPVKWLIKGALSRYDGNKPTRVMRKLANDCREYLALLGDPETSHTYASPVWLGMSKVEDDWTLLWFVYENIGNMWD
jgi:hypothetical protein